MIGAAALSALPLARVAGDLLATPEFSPSPTLPEAHAQLESAQRWHDDAVFTGAAVGAACVVAVLLVRRSS